MHRLLNRLNMIIVAALLAVSLLVPHVCLADIGHDNKMIGMDQQVKAEKPPVENQHSKAKAVDHCCLVTHCCVAKLVATVYVFAEIDFSISTHPLMAASDPHYTLDPQGLDRPPKYLV